MNQQLLDPSKETDYPEVIEKKLCDGTATYCAFNYRGNLLVVGCSDGIVLVWDFDTYGIARTLVGHVRPITSVSWTRNSKHVLSSALHDKVYLWDVESGTVSKEFVFDSAVQHVQTHPTKDNLFLACLVGEPYLLVDIETDIRVPVLSFDSEEEVVERTATASFSQDGSQIFIGGSKGKIWVIDTESLTIVKVFSLSGTSVKHISFSNNGKFFAVISADKTIRVCHCNDLREIVSDGDRLEAHQTLRDPVNQTQWKTCRFSNNSELIVGGSSASKDGHNIYIWNMFDGGQLLKMLEGPKEGFMDLIWHPVRPVIVSSTKTGNAYVWTKNYIENWSAFAPDFTELEENKEYEEREDEFDVVPDDEKIKNKEFNEDEDVDICGVPVDDNDNDDMFFLPVRPEPDLAVINAIDDQEEEETPNPSDDSTVGCFCELKKEAGFMLQCESCKLWCHGKCYELLPTAIDDDFAFKCKTCEEKDATTKAKSTKSGSRKRAVSHKGKSKKRKTKSEAGPANEVDEEGDVDIEQDEEGVVCAGTSAGVSVGDSEGLGDEREDES